VHLLYSYFLMKVLGIETTCDETACAVVDNGIHILSNVVTSQIDLHAEYGGVVPELACRYHVDAIIPAMREALHQAEISLSDIDLIAVAYGPGLIGALLIGLTSAKALSLALGKPFIGINHIEAHLYAAMMSHPEPIAFPCLGVVISGGHTALVRILDVGRYELIGQTVDDAIGEAFDKVGKILGLPYPGGPQIEKLARDGDKNRYPFRAGRVKERPLDFSFSGLKTAVLYTLRGQNGTSAEASLTEKDKRDVAAAFQHVISQDIVDKTLQAAEQWNCGTVIFGGGVANNQYLRQLFSLANASLDYRWPLKELTLDNAAMIAGLGYHRSKMRGNGDALSFEAATRISFRNP
jgi:N6-L-threonylcarbamoyladenine synthase